MKIAAPPDKSVFTAPASFTVTVNASDPDDGIMDVEFYLGNDMVDDVWNAPYAATLRELGPGTYTLTTVAYDYSGGTGSDSISFEVVEGPAAKPSMTAPCMASGQMQFTLTGLTGGKNIVLQACGSLAPGQTWTSLQTNVVNSSSMVLSAPVVGRACFFRVLQLP